MIFHNPSKKLTLFFDSIPFAQAQWLTMAITPSKNGLEQSAQWEVHTSKEIHLLRVSADPATPEQTIIEAWNGKKKTIVGEIDTSSFMKFFAPFFDKFMMSVRDKIIEAATHESTQAINPTNEPQGIEWLRTSFLVLKSAMEQAFGQSALSSEQEQSSVNHMEMLLFCGLQPNTGTKTLRLRLFNLDLDLIEDKSHTLRLSVLNKGRSEHFNGLEPVFTGFFTKSKQAVSDEFIQLLVPLAKAFYLSFWQKLPA